jgi:hypothetical protein
MATQSVSIEYALKQAQYLLATGNPSGAQQIYSKILEIQPGLHIARQGLTAILKDQSSPMTEQGIVQALNEVHQAEYFKYASIKGWTYALVIDHPYINADFQKTTSPSAPKSKTFEPSKLNTGTLPSDILS